jgi:hypothetical protein
MEREPQALGDAHHRGRVARQLAGVGRRDDLRETPELLAR